MNKKFRKIVMLSLSIIIIFNSMPIFSGDYHFRDYKSYSSQLKQTMTTPNIIIMIGDGMGPNYEEIASLIEYGVPNGTIMEQSFPYKALYHTETVNGEITDSAAAGTAISTGVKTKKGYVGMDKYGHYLKTILEYLLHDANYSTGLVTTTSIPHATPATFSSHVESRSNEGVIWDQEMSQGIDVLMGGYGTQISTKSTSQIVKDIEFRYGYPVATNITEMYNLSIISDKFVGLFGTKYLPYEIDRNVTTTPSIIDMTKAALNLLTRKSSPFFLMVEGGRIDHAGHANNLTNAVIETIIFEKAVRYVRAFAEELGNTIVIVVADHETCGLVLNKQPVFSNNTLPSKGFSRNENMTIRLQRILQLDASFTAPYHTSWPVHFYGYGPGLEGSNQSIHHLIDIFWVLNKALGCFPVIIDSSFKVIDNILEISLNITDQDDTVNGIIVHITYDNINYEDHFIPVEITSKIVKTDINILPEKDFSFYLEIIDPLSPFNTTYFMQRYTYNSGGDTNPVNTSNNTSLNPKNINFLDSFSYIVVITTFMIIFLIKYIKKF